MTRNFKIYKWGKIIIIFIISFFQKEAKAQFFLDKKNNQYSKIDFNDILILSKDTVFWKSNKEKKLLNGKVLGDLTIYNYQEQIVVLEVEELNLLSIKSSKLKSVKGVFSIIGYSKLGITLSTIEKKRGNSFCLKYFLVQNNKFRELGRTQSYNHYM